MKYRLDSKKSATLKGRSGSKSGYPYSAGSPAGPLAILDPSFQLAGSLTLTLASVNSNKFMLDGVGSG